jgi:carbamoyl-phosphate synthase large subunit
MILGGGPNRIGQGIEFDYCCVHAALALREDGFETIMVNCNPETVSTDYDTSDRLYFEPLTLEDVLEVIDKEKPEGVIVQYGGQTPLKLCRRWVKPVRRSSAPRPTPSTSPRTASASRSSSPSWPAPAGQRTARTEDAGDPPGARGRLPAGRAAVVRARRTRDGGRLHGGGPAAVHDGRRAGVARRARCCSTASSTTRSKSTSTPSATASRCYVGGIMEHIEQAGVHSGDSGCSPAAQQPEREIQDQMREQTRAGARLDVVGLMNIQFAIQNGLIYVLEVNPRASRTAPFVSKATGVELAKIGARVMTGRTSN